MSSNSRKIKKEIDLTLRKIKEGFLIFQDLWDKIYSHTDDQTLQIKYCQELKRELKKLQRCREQVKNWIGQSSSLKIESSKKEKMIEVRKAIEKKMEQFKECEREVKTKTYSKEGLRVQTEAEAREVSRSKRKEEDRQVLEVIEFMTEFQEQLNTQIEETEEEIEEMEQSTTRGRRGQEAGGELEIRMERHRFHEKQFELILDHLRKGHLDPDEVKTIKDDLEYYLESNRDLDFFHNDEVYDELELDDVDAMKERKRLKMKQRQQKIQEEEEEEEKKKKKLAAKAKEEEEEEEEMETNQEDTGRKKRNETEERRKEERVVEIKENQKRNAAVAATTKRERVGAGSNTRKEDENATTTQRKKRENVGGVAATQTRYGVKKKEQDTSTTARKSSKKEQQDAADAARTSSKRINIVPRNEESLVDQNRSTTTAEGPREQRRVGEVIGSFLGQEERGAGERAAAAILSKTSSGRGFDDQGDPRRRDVDDGVMSLKELGISARCAPRPEDSARSQRYVPRNPSTQLHASFPRKPPSSLEHPRLFEKFDTDALFFIFYHQQGTYQQYMAARELKKQSWRFHTKYSTWFQRHEEPKRTTDEFEQGTYVYFDYEGGWYQRIKSEFTFEYSYLEDGLSS